MTKKWLVAVLMGGSILTSAAVKAQIEHEFDIPEGGRLQVSINGQRVDAFSSPGMPSLLSLKRSLALRLFGSNSEQDRAKAEHRFKLISFARNADNKIGPIIIKGFLNKADLSIGSTAHKITAKWSQVDAYDMAEVLAGPYAIPEPVVRYHLRKARGAEREVTIPLLPDTWWVAATSKMIGGKSIRFAFAPQFATTVASAAAGAAISAELGGAFTGAAQRVMISHGVDRPARAMRLTRPLDVGPVSIDRMMVRVADFGSAASIQDEEIDPSEMMDDIVVNGKRKPSKASFIVYIGADALSGCASITYDKPRHLIRMMCK